MPVRDDFYTPTDLDALRMENELLALENRLLRSRGDLVTRDQMAEAVTAARRKAWERRASEAEQRREKYAMVRHARHERMRRAEADLTRLVRRLDASPVGPLLRLRPEWRALRRRWISS